jgi:hypothetical protein
MAARKQSWNPAAFRDKIRAGMLINRLETHAEGKIEMSASQVSAALGLLKKCVPDLSSQALTGHDGGELKIVVTTGVPRAND